MNSKEPFSRFLRFEGSRITILRLRSILLFGECFGSSQYQCLDFSVLDVESSILLGNLVVLRRSEASNRH